MILELRCECTQYLGEFKESTMVIYDQQNVIQSLKGKIAWCKQCVALVERFGNYQDTYATGADMFEQKK